VIDIKVPDIGDFSDVPVIEVLVAVGEEVAAEQPLITLESDKATMEIPAPAAGVVGELLVALGDKVSEGTPILRLEPTAGDGASAAEPAAGGAAPEAEPAASDGAPATEGAPRVPLVVIGGGPGGYTAAFRAADLGIETILVERYERLGGVCLNVGCIPSKALLHVARVIAEAEEAEAGGVRFAAPEIDLDAMRTWKSSVVDRLTGGLDGLAKQRKVHVVQGSATFTGPNAIEVGGEEIAFEHCIIAAGSSATRLPFLPEDPRIMDSTGALDVEDVPARLLVIGGGIIGLEMATVYDALGAGVTVVEMLDQIIPGADPDIVRPLHRRIKERYDAVHLGVTVTAVEAAADGLRVTFEGGPEPATFDRILVAVGRRPNGATLNAGAADVAVDERGFIGVDEQMRTNVGHIFAIGDIVGEPMLAHKAFHEGKVAAEVIAGENVAFDARTIPSVAYTDPEVAWTGLTESDAAARGIEVEKATFPWAASGRALGLGRSEGVTKVLVDPDSRRVLGAGVVGVNAGELMAELGHAIEMGADAEDLALTIHPHPTLSETVGLAAEAATGTITDLYLPKRAARRSTASALSS
jgi:dihydrolipoamide dehydrogenase